MSAPIHSLSPSYKSKTLFAGYKAPKTIARRPKMATSVSAYHKLLSVGTKIIAVGRNYAAHAKELGNAVPKEPVLFLKPTSSYLENGGKIEVPEPLEALDHEVELAVVIGQRARDVPEAKAMDYVGGYALALDMTAREIQSTAKSAGLPWSVAKGQDTFTPISSVLPTSMLPDPHNVELWLKVDGEIRQKGSTSDMIFKIPFLISHISSLFTLLEGDVILTGTPQGVGPVKIGQRIDAGITGLLDVHFDVGRRHRVRH
ncbi:putative fumarylacetoacetate hydrolase [Handroanthus impetiginosus]|uniref:Putative fumarylacetoacetate hydralase n=1 Tax=Handroanthus impetiginosus TaxID=429701 RepID=A0A2G9H3H3_9LAMI|nr:putative fumarylacetoacetate hydrolase [Handroanthus impetiginosus]